MKLIIFINGRIQEFIRNMMEDKKKFMTKNYHRLYKHIWAKVSNKSLEIVINRVYYSSYLLKLVSDNYDDDFIDDLKVVVYSVALYDIKNYQSCLREKYCSKSFALIVKYLINKINNKDTTNLSSSEHLTGKKFCTEDLIKICLDGIRMAKSITIHKFDSDIGNVLHNLLKLNKQNN